MMLVAFRRLVLQCVKPTISLAMLYVNVVVSHVYDSTRVTLCNGFWVVFQTSVYQTGQAGNSNFTATGIRTRVLTKVFENQVYNTICQRTSKMLSNVFKSFCLFRFPRNTKG
jgi:hypothetical protein